MALNKQKFVLKTKNESTSVQKVVQWLRSLHHIYTGDQQDFGKKLCDIVNNETLDVSLFNSLPSLLSTKSSLSEVKNDSNDENNVKDCNQREGTSNDESTLLLKSVNLNSGHAVLKNWTLKKVLSSHDIEVIGQLFLKNKNKIVDNFSAGIVLSRPKKSYIKTSKGEFLLSGVLHDSKHSIPLEVKTHFADGFPQNWKNIVKRYWSNNHSSNSRKNKDIKNDYDSSLSSVNDFEKSISEKKDSLSEKSGSYITEKGKKKSEKINNKNINGKNQRSKTGKKQNDDNDNKPTKATNDNEIILKNWSVDESSHGIVVKGCRYNLSADKNSNEEILISRNMYHKVASVGGPYLFMGNVKDPKCVIPSELQTHFQNAFPQSWQSIIITYGKHKNADKKNAVNTNRGKKRPNVKNINETEGVKLQKVNENTKKVVPKRKNKENSNNSMSESEMKEKNLEVKEKIEENIRKKKEAAKNSVGRKYGKNKCNDDDSLNENSLLQNEHLDEVKKPNKKEQNKNKKVNNNKLIKRISLTINKKRFSVSNNNSLKNNKLNVKSKKPNKKAIEKNKTKSNKNKKDVRKTEQENDFDLQFNRTNDFFRTFDNDCGFSDGLAAASFKEVSLGACVRSAKKKVNGANTAGSETPYTKYVGDVLSHSITSNQSAHSANSSANDITVKRADVIKRVQKLNKVKKKSENSNKNGKRFGCAKVNTVFKEVTKKSIATSTPKIVKKIFRSKTPRDEDDSMPIDSSDEESLVFDNASL